jgi:hypothetical protein
MNELGNAITAHLKARGWKQKDFAAAWHGAVGNGEAFATYEPKLSKLIKGQREGIKFLDDEARFAGFARTLERRPEEVRQLIDVSEKEVTLVLDPRLPENVVAFFRARCSEATPRVRLVEPAKEDDPKKEREGLREATTPAKNAVVVMNDSRHEEFFAGADVRWSRYSCQQTGFEIEALPHLFPRAIARKADTDGTPMVEDADLEHRCRQALSHQVAAGEHGREGGLRALVARVQAADAAYEPVTFRIDAVVAARGRAPKLDDLLSAAIEKATHDPARKPYSVEHLYLWMHERSVLSLRLTTHTSHSSSAASVPAEDSDYLAIKKHTPIHNVTTFQTIVDAIKQHRTSVNPRRDGSTSRPLDVSAELEAFKKETGLVLTIPEEKVRQAIRSPSRFVTGRKCRVSAEADQVVQDLLDDVLAREFELRSRSSTFEEPWLPHELVAIRDARMVHIEADAGQHEFWAHLGGGELRRVRIHQYAAEHPTSMQQAETNDSNYRQDSMLDGGNIRIEWSREKTDVLRTVDLATSEQRRRDDDDD